MVFLSATNILGYIVLNKMNAVIFFVLVSFLVYNFSKNMSIVLLVGIIATNLLMSNKRMREGMENTSDNDILNGTAAQEDPTIINALNAVKSSSTVEEAQKKIKEQQPSTTDSPNIVVPMDLTNTSDTINDSPQGVGAMTNMNGGKQTKNTQGSRIDYASTLGDAYKNLNEILGAKGIEGLTNETMSLMENQKKLMEQMEGLMPVVTSAQNMLKGFDMKSLGDLANMASQFNPVKK